jgi:hypothetical protein
MPNRKLIFADQARGAVLRACPSIAYVIEQVPIAFNLVYCEECYYFKQCRVVGACSNPNGLKVPEPKSFCPFGRHKGEQSED